MCHQRSWSRVKSLIGSVLTATLINSCCALAAQTSAAVEDDTPGPALSPIVSSLDLSAIDRTADPCADFYQYACGNWIKDNPLPVDQVRWVRSFSQLEERTLYQLWQELDLAASNPHGSLQKKYGDYFAACMNVAEIESKGLQTLEPTLQRISALGDAKEIAALAGDLASEGETPLLFQLDVERDQKDSSRYLLNLLQGGLSLPDRSLYVGHSKFALKRLNSHVTRVFMLAGDSMERSIAEAEAVIGIETQLATASTLSANSSDPASRYHIYTVADLQKLAPDFDFAAYFRRITTVPIKRLNVTNPDFVKAMNGLIRTIPIYAWRSYFRWHLLSEQAEALPKAYRDEDFTFRGAILERQQKPAPRWMRCTAMTDQALGDAISQDWVKRNFPPAVRAGAEQIVAALEHALGDEIRSLPWMSEETKRTAEAKLAAIQARIGYPDHWRDYSKLNVDRTDFVGNMHRLAVFQRDESFSRLEHAGDDKIWDLEPFTVEARYVAPINGLYVPAGLLQSPFFDLATDPAVNFGAIGVLTAHELTHGFDGFGSNFDEKGNVREWQTAQDRQNFAERTSCEVAEYNQFGAMPDAGELPLIKVNGKLTQAENTADNGGLRIAFLALTQALGAQGKTAEYKVDGLTETQRFFLSFAQMWCENQNFRSARQAAAADPHSPGRGRVNGSVRNFEEFGRAFGCHIGSVMSPVNSCRVW